MLANRRVDADRQRDHESDYQCQDSKLNGHWKSGEYLLLYGETAEQRVAQGAA